MSIETTSDGPVTIVTIDRPEVRNAVDRESAAALHEAFLAFDADETAHVAVLTGTEGTFCSGADLKSMAAGDGNAVVPESAKTIVGTVGPMGPTRMRLSKPVIAAVEGHAVAGGLELALWCDLRVAAVDAVFGVYCRRWGVPLVDGGTVRLPRLIGQSNANDLILTGRGVAGDEARRMGLANRLTPPGQALEAAVELAHEIASFPQRCTRNDRRSSYLQWDLDLGAALANETDLGLDTITAPEFIDGVVPFLEGKGRGGSFDS